MPTEPIWWENQIHLSSKRVLLLIKLKQTWPFLEGVNMVSGTNLLKFDFWLRSSAEYKVFLSHFMSYLLVLLNPQTFWYFQVYLALSFFFFFFFSRSSQWTVHWQTEAWDLGWMDFELLNMLLPLHLHPSPHSLAVNSLAGRQVIMWSQSHLHPRFFHLFLFFELSSGFLFPCPISFENKLKIVCRHNLWEYSAASK